MARRYETQRNWKPYVIGGLLALLLGSRMIAGFTIDYQWWKEVGQLETWFSLLAYGLAPQAAAVILAYVILWLAHTAALRFTRVRLRDYPVYTKIAAGILVLPALIIGTASIDSWTVVRFFGGRGLSGAAAWRDPVFDKPLSFYLFELPFYNDLLGFVLGLSFVSALIFLIVSQAWTLINERGGIGGTIYLNELRIGESFESAFLKLAAAIFLFALAGRWYLGRYGMLLNDHGFMVGVDYVNDKFTLPLNWLTVFAFIAAAILLWLGMKRLAILLVVFPILQGVIPRIVHAVYVRPNEIALQTPYIERHIGATRAAYGFGPRTKEVEFGARLETKIHAVKHRPLLENVRLWDWRAFHDTVTQIQALRPYYVFNDTDVDRYMINGQIRQMMLTPRELEIRQLPEARTRWINPHFIYTHGYGLVMAEASKITPDGLPVLSVKNAPPEVEIPGLKLTRPEIYYGEVVHEPVFVHTAQQEFNYPSGADNVHTRYAGTGGFPISSPLIRLAAAVREADWNIILTGLITSESRMMIRRRIADRLQTIAGFLTWDSDPYLVVTDDGRLVWIADAYTTSSAHPYSRDLRLDGVGRINYIRNSVKATIDAYEGSVRLYVFDPEDPIVRAYQRIFPNLLKPAAEMPADLRRHARYPELKFRVQAEIYRTFHMRDPQAFYNKEDLWDLARNIQGQEARPEPLQPAYVVATLPGETRPEFLLTIPFTPRNKDNLIGLMVARCDGENLGELIVLQLSKQALVFGPMQIEARINQDQNISKDLSLWNREGSRVLRGQMIVLPIEDSILYVESIYIQSAEARMPQLKKVAVGMGNTLIYTDTYEEAIAQLTGVRMPLAEPVEPSEETSSGPPAVSGEKPAGSTETDRRLEAIRGHLRRYRELLSQGKYSEAGRELEAIESQVQRR
jgi:uncharacterized membrane protein (UPF0182 family)